MLGLVGLSEPARRLSQYPHELSGGMRQRVMIAMAMATDPAILIADEPTTALDVTIQAQILDLMRDLKRRFEASMILITHDMGVVAEMADHVVVMYRGREGRGGPGAGDLRGAAGRLYPPPAGGSSAPRQRRQGALAAAGEARPDKAESAPILLETEGMTKRFTAQGGWRRKPGEGVLAMDEVGFFLRPGETLALVGESGSGKSTTGRAVLRLLEVDEGSITLEGRDLRLLPPHALRAARRRMQMIFQDPFASLNPRHSVGRLVAEPMTIHGIARGSDLLDRVAELFRRVGLEADHMRRYPHEFSGGQRQRICVARALGVGPRLIVADEPTSALDVSVQAQILELLLELQESLGLAFLFISHDMAVVERVSHRIAVMHRGRIVELGPSGEVLGAPRHPYTRALLAAVPVPDPTRQRGHVPPLDLASLPRGPLQEVAAGHLVAA